MTPKGSTDENCVADTEAMLNKADERLHKARIELQEKEAELAHYIQENDFLRQTLRRIIGV